MELPAGQPASLQVWGEEAGLQVWGTPEAGVKDRELEETGIKNWKPEETGVKDRQPEKTGVKEWRLDATGFQEGSAEVKLQDWNCDREGTLHWGQQLEGGGTIFFSINSYYIAPPKPF